MDKRIRVLTWLVMMLSCSSFVSSQIIGLGSNWHYLDNGSDQGTTWKETGFDDSGWADGNAGLGYPAGAGISTVLSFGPDANNKYITTYFRKTFTIPDINQLQYIKLTLKRDDGAVIYINGTEVVRSNMPSGTITYQTLAPGNQNGTYYYTLPASAFVQGTNVIAVSIHQNTLTSSDILFDLSLENVTDQLVVGAGTQWKFLDTGTDLGSTWRDASYNDAAWQSGLAPLGYTAPGVITTVSFGPNSAAKYPTTYFRKKVTIQSGEMDPYDSLKLTLTLDDGAILYLNGVEIMRRNMPATGVTYSTLANVTVGSSPSTFVLTIPKTGLIVGENIFAAEIHQVTAGSSDIYFDLQVTPVVADFTAVASGSAWKYHDLGTPLAADWSTTVYNDASWQSGAAPLGYGNGDEATVVSFGPQVANKYPTTYFRKTFSLASLAGYNTVRIRLKRDDAARIFVNGTDVYRSNLPSGVIDYSTFSLTPVEGAEEDQWLTIYLPIAVLQTGNNTIAVEVHKSSATETDLRFDLTLDLQSVVQTPTVSEPYVACNPSLNTEIGCFTSVKPSAQTQGLVIPSTHTFQLLMKQGMTNFYTNDSKNVPGNTDFTGYIPSNGSSRTGIVSVNHENDPGDVSLLSVNFNDSTKLWSVDSARIVDFTPLVRTTRNCSGGVTPWGTVVTSEETYATGDVNGDGYHDRGWQVEIDPVSGKVIDQNNDGTPDKLWAMGRMNHENICISADSAVAYQAEDGGTSGVYKYVMAVKGKLSAGTLYVLKRDTPSSTTGIWVQVPNTTQAERNTVSTVITSLGGTNWNGPEDIEFGPDGNMYFTSKGTGTIWRFHDDGNTVSNLEAWVTNTNYPIAHSEGTTSESFGTGIDNLAFDNEGNLWAQQDGGRGHLWVVRPDHTPATPKVDLFGVTPAGAESTGLTFTPDGRYGFFSFQHPSASGTVVDAANQNVVFNASTTVVFARKEFLGGMAVEPRFELGNNLSVCDSVVLYANTTGQDIVNVWQDNSTADSLIVTQTGWYKATAYSNNGRFYSDSIFVTVTATPASPALTASAACFGTPVSDLQAVGTNVQWYDQASLATPVHSGNNFNSGQTAAGTYMYYATQSLNGCVSGVDSVAVTIHTLPAAPVASDVNVCEQGTIPALNATGTTIRWYADATLNSQVGSGNTFTSTETVVGTYNYYVTQTDANMCQSNPSTVVLNILPLPVAPATNAPSVCEGQVVPALTASGTSVEWYSDPQLNVSVGLGSTLNPAETTSGNYTYYATQTDANGCVSAAASAVLTIHALPASPTANSEAVCDGTTVPDLTVSGSSPLWYSDAGLTNQVATGTVFTTGQTLPGTYNYFVTQTDANGCVSAATPVTLAIQTLPAIPSVNSVAVCEGLTVPALSAAGTSIEWYDDAQLTTNIGSGATLNTGETTSGSYNYYATQTDANGCVSPAATATLIIHSLPAAPLTTGSTVCEGLIIPALTASGTTVEWYNDAQLTNNVGSGGTLNPVETVSGSYNYYATQTDANGCISSPAMATLTILALPVAPQTTSEIVCEGMTVPDLSANGNSPIWYSDAALNNQVATGTQFATGQTLAGTYAYYVTQTDANGCVSPSSMVSLTINALPLSPVLSGQQDYCAGEELSALTATGNGITWYADVALTTIIGNGTTLVPAVNTTTMFYATQTVSGCEGPVDSILVTIHALPQATIYGLQSSYGDADLAVTLTGIPAGGIFDGPGVNGNQFDPQSVQVGGPYLITYTYTDPVTGCEGVDSAYVSITSSVGLVTLEDGSSYEVFPNPARELMTVRFNLPQDHAVGIELLDQNGKIIVVQSPRQFAKGQHAISLERSALHLEGGTYWMKVIVDDKVSLYQVVFY